MPNAWTPPDLALSSALRVFATQEKTQASEHIHPLHRHFALRLVLEGGFLPDEITPRPPMRVETRKKRQFLIFDESAQVDGEQTILGGLKTKKVDVVVTKPGIGPVLAMSFKGTFNAFRNLTNRMEEAGGDCTNLHIMYPGLVYGFFHVLRGNEEGTAGLAANDIAVKADGQVIESILRYQQALLGLTGRRLVRDDLTRYEAVAIALVEMSPVRLGQVIENFPRAEPALHPSAFLPSLLTIYDLRYPYFAASVGSLERHVWSPESPVFEAMGDEATWETRFGFLPRVE